MLFVRCAHQPVSSQNLNDCQSKQLQQLDFDDDDIQYLERLIFPSIANRGENKAKILIKKKKKQSKKKQPSAYFTVVIRIFAGVLSNHNHLCHKHPGHHSLLLIAPPPTPLPTPGSFSFFFSFCPTDGWRISSR